MRVDGGGSGGRAPEIDAIRGWAALSVVCFHVFWETFGICVPWLRNPYTAFLLAGHFDVILFFILSGDALSFPFFHGGGSHYLQRAFLKRYIRLTVPIVVVTFVTAVAMAGGLTPTEPAAQIVGRMDWLGSFARFHVSGATAIAFAFFKVYQGNYRANYLPFLWTMPIELSGSFILLLVLFVYTQVRSAGFLVAALAFALLWSEVYAGCFLIGLLLGKARADGIYAKLPTLFGRALAPAGVVVALALVGHRQASGDQSLLGLTVLGALLLFCLYSCPPAVGWLSTSKLSQFLGKISYLLYLWHFFILITLTSQLIIGVSGSDGVLSTASAVAIGILTVSSSVLMAHTTLIVEYKTRDIGNAFIDSIWKIEE